MAYAPVVTAFSDMAPTPRAQVVFEALDPATRTVTVYQSADQLRKVADGIDAYAVGGFTVTDYLIPGGVDVSYYAEMFDDAGVSLGLTDSTSVQVAWDPSMVVFSDPSDPATAVLLEAVDDFAGRVTRSRQLSLYSVGSRVVSLAGQPGLIEKLSLHSQAKTLEDADMMQAVLSRPLVAVRAMKRPVRIPPVLIVAIASWDELPVDVQWGGEWSQFELDASEVSPSRVSIIVPVVSWQAYMDAFPTWLDFMAAYDTWLDAMRNPPNGEGSLSPRLVEDPSGSGLFTTGTLIEDPPGSGFFIPGVQNVEDPVGSGLYTIN